MKMIRTAAILCLLAIGIAVTGVACNKASTSTEAGATKQQYTCPMHPEVVKDEPGKCPKCGMALVPKK